MRGYCGKCKKRKTCTELCEEVLDYVDQDYGCINEGLIGINIENYDKYDASGHVIWPELNFNNSSVLKGVIIKLHKDGKSTREIAELVPCSQQYVSKVTTNLKKYTK